MKHFILFLMLLSLAACGETNEASNEYTKRDAVEALAEKVMFYRQYEPSQLLDFTRLKTPSNILGLQDYEFELRLLGYTEKEARELTLKLIELSFKRSRGKNTIAARYDFKKLAGTLYGY